MIPGPMAWAIRLPNILLELWSDRRSGAGCCCVVESRADKRVPPCGDQRQLRIKMKTSRYSRAFQAAFIGIAMTGSVTIARADIKDYEFQLVDKTVKTGDAVISVRLIHKPDGKPVSDAVIFAKRLDMAPDGMETMKTTIEAIPSTEPGVYKFKAAVTMQGGWRLSLGAKVQGETGTVESKLVITAQK